MKSSSLGNKLSSSDVGVYECELHVKFTMIEERWVLTNREHLFEILLDALSCGADDYLEPDEITIRADEIPETSASASIRRQIIKLRNSDSFA